MIDNGNNIKWDHFEILERIKSNKHCLIKESILIKELSPSLNGNIIVGVNNFLFVDLVLRQVFTPAFSLTVITVFFSF